MTTADEVTKDVLDDIFASVDAAESADCVANSCDEESDESDLDLPKALPPLTPPPQRARYTNGIGGKSVGTAPRKSLVASMSNARPGVITSGGKVVGTGNLAGHDPRANYFMVQWRKPQQKKHKTWDGDAYLKVEGSRITMISEEGKHMGTAVLAGGLPESGSELRIASMDCEVDRSVTFEDFKRATSCLNNPSNMPVPASTSAVSTPMTSRLSGSTPGRLHRQPFSIPFKTPTMTRKPAESAQTPAAADPNATDSPGSTMKIKGVSASSFYNKTTPAKTAKSILIGEKNSKQREQWGGALHDPKAENAIVMKRPPEGEAIKRKTTIVDVVIDPRLSAKMRDHQKQGVAFMYECVMGMTGANGCGAILADEMGLGKTLQTIALIYTLCRQSPFAKETSVINRALVVCPVSLVQNWKNEFQKWVPRDFRIVAVEDGDDNKIRNFTQSGYFSVLIIGYERLRKVMKLIAACQPPVGLIVCDEGHRLKSKDNKTTKMFSALSTPRRIILTGTPVQNNLSEYWAMADFACPGILGTYSSFARHYEKPILKGRTSGCSPADVEKGIVCSSELGALSQEFVLRRDHSVLKNFLPPKSEYVVFVAPSKLQLDVFGHLLGGGKNAAQFVKGLGNTQCLAMIDLLRKVANSPALLTKKYDDPDLDSPVTSSRGRVMDLIKAQTHGFDPTISGKLAVLERILTLVYRSMDEKIVVVSNWTSTLDIIQELCVKKRYNFLRLDGSTPQKQRQTLVNQFNRSPRTDSMVFLLSAKAGGVGLNLIGASRLVLFDSDWNPSTDLQAMARIHRDGQTKPVFIYRLLTTNSIDEKIYQRQITKTSLSDQMMAQGQGEGSKGSKDSFSFEELRDIFTVNVHTGGCQTHDLLACFCGGRKKPAKNSRALLGDSEIPDIISDHSDSEPEQGFMAASQFDPEPILRQAEKELQAKLAALKSWDHLDAFKPESFRGIEDNLLYNLIIDDYEKHNDSAPTSTSQTPALSDEDTPLPPKKRRKTILDITDEVLALKPPAPSSPQGGEEDADEDDFEIVLPRRRKRPNGSSSRSKVEKPVIHDDFSNNSDMKHDLCNIAENGQAGRILFVFEKVSKAAL